MSEMQVRVWRVKWMSPGTTAWAEKFYWTEAAAKIKVEELRACAKSLVMPFDDLKIMLEEIKPEVV